MQANWKLNFQVAAGKVRMLDMQSSFYQGETENWVFCLFIYVEPEGIVSGIAYAPK